MSGIFPPFNYNVSHLNGNLDYTNPNHKLIILFKTVVRATTRSQEIKLSIPIDDGGDRGFIYTLEVANVFDDIVITNCALLTKTIFCVTALIKISKPMP